MQSSLPNAGYWNAGGQQNVESMLTYLTEKYLRRLGAAPAAMVETPATGDHTGVTGAGLTDTF